MGIGVQPAHAKGGDGKGGGEQAIIFFHEQPHLRAQCATGAIGIEYLLDGNRFSLFHHDGKVGIEQRLFLRRQSPQRVARTRPPQGFETLRRIGKARIDLRDLCAKLFQSLDGGFHQCGNLGVHINIAKTWAIGDAKALHAFLQNPRVVRVVMGQREPVAVVGP